MIYGIEPHHSLVSLLAAWVSPLHTTAVQGVLSQWSSVMDGWRARKGVLDPSEAHVSLVKTTSCIRGRQRCTDIIVDWCKLEDEHNK
jgi:hypothetical protein